MCGTLVSIPSTEKQNETKKSTLYPKQTKQKSPEDKNVHRILKTK
jgi:hypothetical protein